MCRQLQVYPQDLFYVYRNLGEAGAEVVGVSFENPPFESENVSGMKKTSGEGTPTLSIDNNLGITIPFSHKLI